MEHFVAYYPQQYLQDTLTPDNKKTALEKKRLFDILLNYRMNRKHHIEEISKWQMKDVERHLADCETNVDWCRKNREFICAEIYIERIIQFTKAKEMIVKSIIARNN